MSALSASTEDHTKHREAIEAMQSTATKLRDALVPKENPEKDISHLLPEAVRPVSIEMAKGGAGEEREEITFTFSDNAGAKAFHKMLQGLCSAESGACGMRSKCDALRAKPVMAGIPHGNTVTTGDKMILEALSNAVEALQQVKDVPHIDQAAAVFTGIGAGMEQAASKSR